MFSARRKPKRINRDEPDRNSNEEEESDNGPVVRRPNAAPRTKSKLRTSFAPDEADDSSDAPPVIVKPKHRLLGQSTSSTSLPRFNADPRTSEENTSRPSYSKSALDELRNSTPSTPKDLSAHDDPSSAEEGIRDLDLASKFGSTSKSTTTSIPSSTEIAERKARRARLAKETAAADFIPLDDDQLYDDDGEFKPQRLQVGTYRRLDADDNDTRLVRDDEDILEGFDNYTEDAESARLTMGRKQLLQAQRRDRDAMRSLIERAEGHSDNGDDDTSNDSEDSDSERERNHAYETAQTMHGMDGLTAVKLERKRAGQDRPRQPKVVTPVPKLAVALGKLRERIAQVEIERVKVERRREEVKKERAEIVASREHIQRSLTEAGEELEKIQQRQRDEEESRSVHGNGGSAGVVGRGLDSMGLTPEPV